MALANAHAGDVCHSQRVGLTVKTKPQHHVLKDTAIGRRRQQPTASRGYDYNFPSVAKIYFLASTLISRVLQDMAFLEAITIGIEMAIPETIKIERIEDYWTHDIGNYDVDSQFMAFIVATLPVPHGRDWAEHKRWYAVLHTFDANGNYLQTQSWFAGVTADGENKVVDKARIKREEMLGSLGNIVYCDVFIKLFSVTIDDHIFGLVDVTEPEDEHEYVELMPNGFVFYPPWDGSFDT